MATLHASPPKKGDKKPELKDLSLATGVDRIPELWERHGNAVLIVLTIAALAYAGWNWRNRSIVQARAVVDQDMLVARDALSTLQSLGMSNPEAYSTIRRSTYENGSAAVSDVLGKSDEKATVARALILQADLAYAVAQLPDAPIASTRPTFRMPESNEQLLTKAKSSYAMVLSQYGTEKSEGIAAHLGLAAIAENAGDFGAAKTHYEAVSKDDTAFSPYRRWAEQRVAAIPKLERPIRFRATSGPATVPADVQGMATRPVGVTTTRP